VRIAVVVFAGAVVVPAVGIGVGLALGAEQFGWAVALAPAVVSFIASAFLLFVGLRIVFRDRPVLTFDAAWAGVGLVGAAIVCAVVRGAYFVGWLIVNEVIRP
jgi:hypothetical protein